MREGGSPTVISKQALQRLPYYTRFLRGLREQGATIVAAPAVAAALGLNEVQVRKDLAAMSNGYGKPKAGFILDELIENMEEALGYHNSDDAVLVGAGSLGRALLGYGGFAECGLNMVAAFDANPALVGSSISGKPVFPMSKLGDICGRMNIHIGVITVPACAAQPVCDELVAAGVLAIWNFAPTHLSVPANILVQSENMAASLALLSNHLRQRLHEDMP
ncbi:MAG: redox-sensing transcriptional repressor Rex [Clostridia bacterium]|nr:redox-sensing transcriptional repressor Rex [Candidatus Pelethousia sp.]NCB29885.1 redox-sensing transcriptional repressor Rex [Clostridia bacterium]